MSQGYVAVNWNRRKVIYDLCLWVGIVLYLATFIVITNTLYQGDQSLPLLTVLLRATSTCAFIMLSLLLCIGPLARLSRRYLPLLYNRRHFGVSLFVVALVHGLLSIYWYHSFGPVNPLVSVFISGGDYQSFNTIPFEAYGAVALIILFILAATSHDYWNASLGGPLWKAIHMGVYLAYALIILHIVLGALQQDATGLMPWMLFVSVGLVGGLHLVAAFTRSAASHSTQQAVTEWVPIGNYQSIPNNRAITVDIDQQERIAVFRYSDNHLCAVSNVCQHQNGPLGEGQIIDGLITCPWHGYQYRPEDGCSPPPFTEKIKTYRLKLEGDQLFVDSEPLPEGTPRPILKAPKDESAQTHVGAK